MPLDGEEGVKFFVELLQSCPLQPTPPSKDEAAALRYKSVGNGLFQARSFVEARNAFTKALLVCQQHSELYAVCLVNRATCSMYLRQPLQARDDLALAEKSGLYPAATTFKLFRAVGNCALELHRMDEARTYYHKALQHLHESSVSAADKVTVEQEIAGKLQTVDEFAHEQPLASHAPAEDGIIEAVSECVYVRQTEDMGRGLFSKTDTSAGTIVIEESPLAWVCSAQTDSVLCDYCLDDALLPIACGLCKHKYCGDACRKKAWQKYHWLECSLPGISAARISDNVPLSLRVYASLLAMLRELASSVKSQSEASDTKSADSAASAQPSAESASTSASAQPSTAAAAADPAANVAAILKKFQQLNDLTSSYHCLSQDQDNTAVMNSASMTRWVSAHPFAWKSFSLKSLQVLQTAPWLGDHPAVANTLKTINFKTGKLDNLAFGLCIFHILMTLTANSFAIKRLHTGKGMRVMRHEDRRVGQGLYLSASAVNHQCDPNSLASFAGKILRISVVRPLKSGQEVTISYGPTIARTPIREQRLKAIKDTFAFDCKCPVCSRTDLDLHIPSVEEEGHNPLLLCKCSTGRIGTTGPCQTCGDVIPEDTRRTIDDTLMRARVFAVDAHKLWEADDLKKAKVQALKTTTLLQSILHPYSRELSFAHDLAAMILAGTEDYAEAAAHTVHSVAATAHRFGEDSVEHAEEMVKFADLTFNAGQLREAKALCVKAIEMCRIFPQFKDDVEDLKKKLVFLKEFN